MGTARCGIGSCARPVSYTHLDVYKRQILYKGKSLPYQIYHQQTRQSEVVMSKDVDAEIKERMPFKPALDHPWHKFSLFKNRANAPAPRGVSTLG